MSQIFNRFVLLFVVVVFSFQVNANNSVPVSDLANDIGTEVIAIPQPAQAVVEEPINAVAVDTPINTNANAQMFDIVEMLQYELQQLRGQVEELSYHLERLKKDQKQRYLDLDRRIVSLSTPPQAIDDSQVSDTKSETGEADLTSAPLGSSIALDQAVVIQEAYDPEIEKLAYKAAFGLIRERQYDASIEALLTFLNDFPEGVLVGNAHYWLGEVYMVQGDASLAAQSFEYVIREFPGHRKTPDALYKAGVAYQNVGNNNKANQLLQRVLQEYPDSSAARLAQERVN
ncbi:MAG: tol-pal system protein YbgF [Pseudomonadales bacterium]|nr:tol-pal system protein YbgF [Pseudomonadales bacterium]